MKPRKSPGECTDRLLRSFLQLSLVKQTTLNFISNLEGTRTKRETGKQRDRDRDSDSKCRGSREEEQPTETTQGAHEATPHRPKWISSSLFSPQMSEE